MIINNEIFSEELRQKLEKRPMFDAYEAFKSLDKSDSGFISLNEFRDVLQENGVYASNTDLLSLVKRYDKNQDGKVSYSDFVQELTPKSPKKYWFIFSTLPKLFKRFDSGRAARCNYTLNFFEVMNAYLGAVWLEYKAFQLFILPFERKAMQFTDDEIKHMLYIHNF